LEIGDGRSFLNKAGTHRYDAVVLDAFLGDSSPSHLMTREAFTAVRRVLKEEGVIVINIFGDFSLERGFLTASLDKTLKAVFASVRIHSSGNGNVCRLGGAAGNLPSTRFRRHPSGGSCASERRAG
jgi:spermidine synthase